MAHLQQRVTFAVPVTGGQFAPEVAELRSSANTTFDAVESLAVAVVGAVASSNLDIDLLIPGRAGTADADYDLAVQSISGAAKGITVVTLNGLRARIRARSGGASGSLIVQIGAVAPLPL